jgi:N-acyl-D-amino-acid deacylase
MFDVILKGGVVLDGSGNPWFKADVAVVDGKITELSKTVRGDADQVIDVHSFTVSPGFVDIHNHSDQLRREGCIMTHNRAENLVRQGITTITAGTCGMSASPLNEKYREILKRRLAGSDQVEIDWLSMREWMDRVEKKQVGLNLAPFVGFGTVRTCVMGEEGTGGERYEGTQDELEQMKKMVNQSMEDGAFGLTTGLEYAPQRNAYTQEVIELAKIVGKYHGLYMSHIRSEDDYLIEAVKEFITICAEAQLRGSISHHKACSPINWGKPNETVRLIEKARSRGVEVMCDLYPWISVAVSNAGRHFVPRDEKFDVEAVLKQLKDPEKWEETKSKSKARVEVEKEENERRMSALAKRGTPCPIVWDPTTYYVIVYSKTNPQFVWKNFKEVAEMTGDEDPWDVMRRIYIEDGGETHLGLGYSTEEDIVTIYEQPWACVSTDASAEDRKIALHPRGYGTYPRFLERYVKELRVMSWEEGIRRMTSLPAQSLGLQDRGLIREGSWADIVVFDPATIKSNAVYGNPWQYPDGIQYILVNGEVVVAKGAHTKALPGKVLRHYTKPN